MSDFLNIYVEGNILLTFVNLVELIVALDVVTLVLMIFGKAKDNI